MAKRADIGGRRLISLAPTAWVRWLLDDNTLNATELVRQIMRWDMSVLRESPWYQEILEEGRVQGLREGLEQGLEQARRDDLRRVLAHRFGELPARVEEALEGLDLAQLERLFDAALEVATLEEFQTYLPPTSTDSNGRGGS